MKEFIEQISVPLFYGFILVIQPFWAWGSAHWLVRRWVSRSRPGLGWLVGSASFVGLILLGWLGIYVRLGLSHRWYGDCPVCFEYAGLSYLFDAVSGVISLVIFLVTAIRVTRRHAPLAPG